MNWIKPLKVISTLTTVYQKYLFSNDGY